MCSRQQGLPGRCLCSEQAAERHNINVWMHPKKNINYCTMNHRNRHEQPNAGTMSSRSSSSSPHRRPRPDIQNARPPPRRRPRPIVKNANTSPMSGGRRPLAARRPKVQSWLKALVVAGAVATAPVLSTKKVFEIQIAPNTNKLQRNSRRWVTTGGSACPPGTHRNTAGKQTFGYKCVSKNYNNF